MRAIPLAVLRRLIEEYLEANRVTYTDTDSCCRLCPRLDHRPDLRKPATGASPLLRGSGWQATEYVDTGISGAKDRAQPLTV
jgi:hypothetical protein